MNTDTADVTRRPLLWRLGPAGIWLMLGAATAWVLSFNPTDGIADPTGPCLWHALTGINGPTCGGTRMFWYLLHANLVQAARHHLAALTGLLYGVYALTAWTTAAHTGRRLPAMAAQHQSHHRLYRTIPALRRGAAQPALAPVCLV